MRAKPNLCGTILRSHREKRNAYDKSKRMGVVIKVGVGVGRL